VLWKDLSVPHEAKADPSCARPSLVPWYMFWVWFNSWCRNMYLLPSKKHIFPIVQLEIHDCGFF